MNGFTIKIRGGGGLIAREYSCSDHGPFEDLVTRGSAGGQPCPVCGQPAPRLVSAPAVHTQFVVSATQGKAESKPHHLSLDTRSLAEGQLYNAWKKDRKKLWDQERKKRVMEL